MINKLGGTRAILAFLLTIAFIAGCFSTMTDIKFTSLGSMALMALTYYFANKSTKDKV
jgi:hypothetical protein